MAAATNIQRQLDLIRRLTDEPTISSKYSDNDLIEHIESANQIVMTELHTAADNAMLSRFNITISDGNNVFLLPPAVEAITRIAKLNGVTGLPDWQMVPSSEWGFRGPGVRIEGRLLRFDPSWAGDSDVLEILYVPNGDFRIHYGTAVAATSTTLQMTPTPTAGILDTRDNAYLGSLLRVVSDGNGYIQERTIIAYNRVTQTATVSPAFSPALSGTITYEVAPSYERFLEKVVSLYVARELRAAAGDAAKTKNLTALYTEARRSLRLELSRRQGIISDAFEHDTVVGGARSSMFWVN